MADYHTLRLILGDQLNINHSWFEKPDTSVLYVLAEMRQETDYVRHHVQKLCGFFAGMAFFAGELSRLGHQLLYLTLDDTEQWQDLPSLVVDLTKQYKISHFEYQRPDEYRVLKQLEHLASDSQISCRRFDTEHFFLQFNELKNYFEPGKHKRMESFYRKMRCRFNYLMADEKPRGGNWNFDNKNRQSLSVGDIDEVVEPLLFSNDVSQVLERLERHAVETIGTPHSQLTWPVSRQQSLELLEYFCNSCLPNFGRFQDAMTARGAHRWSLYHSRLSFALNCKMLSPREVIEAAIRSFESSPATIDIAQVEGFVRQILGWREYIRGVYWINMPGYSGINSLSANRDLPKFFWTGKTTMHCMQQSIEQSIDFAYAHHIQRLMVTGNFCLLAGIDPDQVDEWYLGIYIDALQWVEMPNTRGMSQYADGGLIATKPYAASGNYINRMSDYCGSCHYKVKDKTGELACPLNSLYWHFMNRHRESLSSNHRTGMIYKTWDRMDENQRRSILERGNWLLKNLDTL